MSAFYIYYPTIEQCLILNVMSILRNYHTDRVAPVMIIPVSSVSTHQGILSLSQNVCTSLLLCWS